METRSGATRRSKRRHTRYPVEGIFGTLLPTTPVTLIDLSRSGLSIEVPERLQVGESYLFRFQHRGQATTVEVKVTWCRRRWGLWQLLRGRGAAFLAGGAIVDLYRDQQDGLWKALEPDPDMAES